MSPDESMFVVVTEDSSRSCVMKLLFNIFMIRYSKCAYLGQPSFWLNLEFPGSKITGGETVDVHRYVCTSNEVLRRFPGSLSCYRGLHIRLDNCYCTPTCILIATVQGIGYGLPSPRVCSGMTWFYNHLQTMRVGPL